MAIFDSAYCLSFFNRLTGRPDTALGGTDAISDPQKYLRLQEAQQEVVADIAAIIPHVLYPTVGYASMPQLTSTDGQVWTFGTDDQGNPIAPIGKTAIYTDLDAIPDEPWVEGVDYLNEGTQIRIPNNDSWSGPLYWRGVTMPSTLDATHQPVLFPEPARQLLCYRAAWNFANEMGRNAALAKTLMPTGDPVTDPRFVRWCLTWRTQFRHGGALGSYTGRQLAILSQP